MKGMNMKAVRCIETGEVWESRKACALALGYSKSKIYNHIRFAEPIDGRMYENFEIKDDGQDKVCDA